MNYSFHFWQIHTLQWLTWFFFGLLVFAFKYHILNIAFTTNLLLGSGIVFLTIVIGITNTIQSPIMSWFCIIPLFAFWLLNGRHALFWLISCIVLYLCFLYLYLRGYHPVDSYNFYAIENSWYSVFGQILLLVNVYIVGADFEYKKKGAIDEINQANQELNSTLNDLKRAKEELEEAQKHKDIFIAQMSHEMRTPMNAICGVSELLLKRKDFDDKELTLILSQASGQLMNIINDILDVSKLQTGKFQTQNITYLLDELIQDVYAFFKKNADEKGLRAMLSVNSIEDVYLKGDPYRLKQILHNILSNAVKFTENGTVHFEVEFNANDRELLFIITDTGIGILEEEISEVFIPFSQANNSIHLKYGGTGMGLNISKQLVELFGGIIHLSSKYGSGTKVKIALPVELSADDKEIFSAGESKVDDDIINALKGIKILLAEDNEVNRIIFKKLITSDIPQISIDTANNGEEVLQKLENGKYDLVMMDIQMPKINGLEATRLIRNHTSEKIKNISIIALSAYARKAEIEECIHSGMNDYLSKPINKNELFIKTYNLIRKK